MKGRGNNLGELFLLNQGQSIKKLIRTGKLRNCILYYHVKFQNTEIYNKEF